MSKGLASKEYILLSILAAFQPNLLGSFAAWPTIYADRLKELCLAVFMTLYTQRKEMASDAVVALELL